MSTNRLFFLVLLSVMLYGGQLRADPLLNFWMVGRVAGTNDQFSGQVPVVAGQAVEYQVWGAAAPVGSTNVQGAVTRTIGPNSFAERYTGTPVVGTGVNSLYLDVWQDPADAIQVSLNPVTLNDDPTSAPGDSWAAGIGARGITSARVSGGSYFDLLGIRPIHGPGVFTAADPEVIFTGSFQVMSTDVLGTAAVRLRWGNGPGMLKMHGPSNESLFVPIHSPTESGPDPVVGFGNPLQVPIGSGDQVQGLWLVSIPEPSAASITSVCVLGLSRRRRRNATRGTAIP